MSIQANELRVNNWVKRNDMTGIFTIRAVCIDRVHPIELIEHDNKENVHWACRCTLFELEPIPLTRKILEACGFYKRDGSKVRRLEIAYSDSDYPCSLQVTGDGIQVCRSVIGAITAPVEFLHQLQNLFYSLTGEELKIENLTV